MIKSKVHMPMTVHAIIKVQNYKFEKSSKFKGSWKLGNFKSSRSSGSSRNSLWKSSVLEVLTVLEVLVSSSALKVLLIL